MPPAKRMLAPLSQRPRLRLALEAVGVYVIAFAILHWRQFLTDHIPGTDGYYHIKIAWIYATEGIPRDGFRWAQFSIWRDHFYDKELGFHLLLIPFTLGDLTHGAKLASVVYGALVYPSFYLILRLLKVRHAWFWTAMFFAAGGYFGYRVNVPRPQILSITIALWAAYVVFIRSWKGALIVGVIYALCYTAPLVIIVYALIAFVIWGAMENDWDWRVLAAATGGVLLGWLVHPHFPNNFRLVWIQLVDVLSNAWGVAGPNLSLGGETKPANTRSWLREHVALYVPFMFAVITLPRAKDLLNKPRFITLFALANAWFIMGCLSKRFVEYWAPLAVWVSAEVFSAAWQSLREDPPVVLRRTWTRWSLVGIVAIFAISVQVATHLEMRKEFRKPGPSGLRAAAEWLEKNTPEDAQVYTCDWDDAPELFFFNHHNRYMVFLDPNFMYKWEPEVWRTWNDVANGKKRQPADVIVTEFKAHYGMCTGNFSALRRQLERDPRAKVMSQGGAFVFSLDPEATYGADASPPRTAIPHRVQEARKALTSPPREAPAPAEPAP